MKKTLGIILIVIMMFGLTACDSNIVDMDKCLDTPDSDIAEFELVDNTFYGHILVDKNTGVLYYWIAGSAGGITPIYNADGTLKIYKEE